MPIIPTTLAKKSETLAATLPLANLSAQEMQRKMKEKDVKGFTLVPSPYLRSASGKSSKSKPKSTPVTCSKDMANPRRRRRACKTLENKPRESVKAEKMMKPMQAQGFMGTNFVLNVVRMG